MSKVITKEPDSNDLNEVRGNPPSPKRFRFSIRLLLLSTLVAAVAISWGSIIVANPKPPAQLEKILGERFTKRSWQVELDATGADTPSRFRFGSQL